MPSQRAPGQKLINVVMKEKFIAQIRLAMKKDGYSDRSAFIRDSVFEKMERLGFVLPRDLAAAPMRDGVGGQPTHKDLNRQNEIVVQGSYRMATKVAAPEVSSKSAALSADEKRLMDSALEEVSGDSPGASPKPPTDGTSGRKRRPGGGAG